MTTEEQYKSFILNCTSSPKSVNNYSDFKRINGTVAKIKGIESFDIYSCVHTKELQDIIDSLYDNEEFKQYDKIGSNQYSNTLKTYMRFLCAKELFSSEAKKVKLPSNLTLQQIYYGAPGTGKSKTIKDLTFGESVIRTTFHPDSDYASFVGTYKPITEEVDLRDCYGKKVIDDDTKEVVKEERIAYKFIPQAFLEAYVEAWKKLGSSKKQYLIIEEINRGIVPKSLVTCSNCSIATNMVFLIILSLQIRICRSISKRNLRDGRLRIKTKSTSSMAKPIW